LSHPAGRQQQIKEIVQSHPTNLKHTLVKTLTFSFLQLTFFKKRNLTGFGFYVYFISGSD